MVRILRFSRRRQSLGVVIPCHNNSWQLRGVLVSLHYQTVKPEMVVVVDDNSSSREASRLRSSCRDFGARYMQLPTPRNPLEELGRRSAARNVGTEHLSTDIILYLDGDMLLNPRYIEEVKEYHTRYDDIYIRGLRRSIPIPYQRMGMEVCLHEVARRRITVETQSLRYIVPTADFVASHAYRDAYYDRWEWCASNNLSVRMDHVVQIGYWDEDFVGWGEEDIEFSFRLYRSGGIPIHVMSDHALAYHLDHPIDHGLNRSTLEKNARHLLTKFPQIAENRIEAYARYGINIDNLEPSQD